MEKFIDEFGVEYSMDRKTLIKAPYDLAGIYKILDECENIADRAFDGCKSLTHIENAYNICRIGSHIFDRCEKLIYISCLSPQYDMIFKNPRRDEIFNLEMTAIAHELSKEESKKLEDLKEREYLNTEVLQKAQEEIYSSHLKGLTKQCEEVLRVCQAKQINMTTFNHIDYNEEKSPLQKATQMYYAYYSDYLKKIFDKLPEIPKEYSVIEKAWNLLHKDWNNISLDDLKSWGYSWEAIHSVDCPELVEYQFIDGTSWSYGDIKGCVYGLLKYHSML